MGILKLGGIASGMDTEGLIKTLMSLEQRPLTNMSAQKDKLTQEAAAWRDLNSRLLTLKNRFDDLKGLTDSLWSAKKASAADATVLTVSADSTAAIGSYTVEVVALATASKWESGQPLGVPQDDPAEALGITGTVKVASGPKAGKSFTVAATDSLNTIVDKINQDKANLGFSASIVQVNPGDYRLVLTGETGAANDFTLDNDGGVAADALGLTAAGGVTRIALANNGTLKVNGLTVTTASNSVKDAIAGTTITLLKQGSSTTVTVDRDTQKVVEAVKKFVDQYNSVVDFLAEKIKYDPKTKTAGTLFGEDRALTIRDSLATRIINPVDLVPDAYKTLSMVGISTEAYKAGQAVTGKLTLDTDKLVKALQADPESVKKLFTQPEIGGEPKTKGIAVRMSEWLENYTKTGGILLGKAQVLDKNAQLIKDRMERFEKQILPMREKRLRDQFTALEKAMSTYQNQGNWLAGQIKSLSGNSDQ